MVSTRAVVAGLRARSDPLPRSCSPLPVAGEEHHDGRNGEEDGGSGFGSVTSSAARIHPLAVTSVSESLAAGAPINNTRDTVSGCPLFSAACDLLVIRRLAAEVGGAISDGTGSGAVVSSRRGMPSMISRTVRTSAVRRLLRPLWDLTSWLLATAAVVGSRYDFQLSDALWGTVWLYVLSACFVQVLFGTVGMLYRGRYGSPPSRSASGWPLRRRSRARRLRSSSRPQPRRNLPSRRRGSHSSACLPVHGGGPAGLFARSVSAPRRPGREGTDLRCRRRRLPVGATVEAEPRLSLASRRIHR